MSRRGRDSYVPRSAAPAGRSAHRPPPARRGGGDRDMYRFGGQSRDRSEFTFRSRISQRDLLTHIPTSEEISVLSQSNANKKFRDVDNLTDSEEEDMSEDIESEDENRAKKRKLNSGDSDPKPEAKWSNPDPYTALPPAPDTAHKRVDVVRLIRKARNETSATHKTSADHNDFISFDNFANDDHFAPPEDAPTGPRADIPSYPARPINAPKEVLGKRKHKDLEDDGLIGSMSRTRFHKNGKILAAWQPIAGPAAIPWLNPYDTQDFPMTALHKEIIDFHEWVKPKEFETVIRQELVERLAKELRRWKPGGKLEAFGSYAAGLYLPTADMDLVYNYNSSRAPRQPKSDVYDFANFLRGHYSLARSDSVQAIGKAKVPIVKFVDELTGLKVDLSFNNNTGIVANNTFREWQLKYPAMPIIVAVIKQFLMIRGLNDNSSGGIGGFATICMVTSLIQNLPTHKHQNLGELLVEFFNLYGNLLDVENVGIRMEPPGYINKKTHPLMRDERPERLVIIDPNRPDNNITGGSTEFHRISDLFSRTHGTMSSRLEDFASRDKSDSNFSLLTDLVGGEFSAYNVQREAILAVYEKSQPDKGKAKGLARGAGLLQPSPTSSVRQTNGNAVVKETSPPASGNKGEARLAKLKRLFPELAQKLQGKTTIGPNQAVALGGWTSKVAMQNDIVARESQAANAAKTKKK